MYVDRPSDHGPMVDRCIGPIKKGSEACQSYRICFSDGHLGPSGLLCLCVGTIISVCLCFSIETVSLFQYYRKYLRVRWSMQVLFNLFKGHGFTKF